VIRATNVLLAGKTIVVAGYGWCSRGIANRAAGHGAHVVVTEVDPIKALEAVMDGYRVMPMMEAAKIGDFFISATGDINVIDTHHMEVMKSGAMVANSGHFNVEINLEGLREMAVSGPERVNAHIEGYELKNGNIIYILGEGRLINLSAANGHPASVMDMSFANQALAAEYMVQHSDEMDNNVHIIPEAIDREIARIKLEAMGVGIDVLTPQQINYLNQWQEGTT
jgi:adenosylhomocysteinase